MKRLQLHSGLQSDQRLTFQGNSHSSSPSLSPVSGPDKSGYNSGMTATHVRAWRRHKVLPMTTFRRHFTFSWGGPWPPDRAPLPVREMWPQGEFRASGTRLCHLPTQPPHLLGAATPLLSPGAARPPPARVTSRPGSGTWPWPEGLEQAGRPDLSRSFPSALQVSGALSWLPGSGRRPPGASSLLPILTTVSAKHRSHFLPSSESDMFLALNYSFA